MQILSVIIFCIAVVGVSAIGLIMFSLWLGSRETYIEPIVVSKDDYKKIQKETNLILGEYVDSVKPAKQKIWCAK